MTNPLQSAESQMSGPALNSLFLPVDASRTDAVVDLLGSDFRIWGQLPRRDGTGVGSARDNATLARHLTNKGRSEHADARAERDRASSRVHRPLASRTAELTLSLGPARPASR